jgi:hypothetical protein
MVFDFDNLPSIAVGDGGDVSLCIAHITRLQRQRPFNHAETVGEVNKL